MADDRAPGATPDEMSLHGLEEAILEAARQARIGVLVEPLGPGTTHVSEIAAELIGCAAGSSTASEAATAELAALAAWRERRARRPGLGGELGASDGLTSPVSIASTRATLAGSDVEIELFCEIAERVATEQALEKSALRFRSLVEAAPDGIVIGLPERLAYANPAAVRLLGYDSVEQLLETVLADHLHPDDLPAVLARTRELRETGRPLPASEIRVKRRGADYVSLEIVDMLVEWEGRAAVLAIVRDASERKQLQAQHVQSDRMTALGTLAAGVAHEINNPLAYVLLNLQYLRRELPKFDGNATRLRQYLERLAEARHGADRVSAIVRDLRAFSRADQDQRGPIDLRRALSSALKVAGPTLADRARIVEDYAQVPPVQGDAARLEQVFLNLLVNAAQALHGQDPEHDEIRVTLRSDDDQRVIVEITDNGAGIAPDVLDRVFDPFFSTKPVGVGTGLGLPICHSIVTSHGGEIRVESQLGQGTTFRVALPALQPAQPQKVHLPTPVPVIGRSRAHVLVVDDELPLASMLSRVLADEHVVRITSSAREALEIMLGDEQFDLVLCDLLMPGMSGMDLYRELRERRPGLEHRLVFMTGGAFTPRASEFLSSVPNARIEKPFDLKQVRRLVHEIKRALER